MSLALATPATANDNECLRSVVYAEARGEGRQGQEAVAHVVLNRAKQSRKSLCTVVNERGQFVRHSAPRSFRFNITAADPTGGATHFRTRDMPMWGKLRRYIRINGHTFYGR